MVTQTMSSQGDRTGQAGTRTGTGSLSRQSSIYSLTLNEVQTHLGEPLHSMNLDDLLRNIFPETGQPPQPILDVSCTNTGTAKKTVDEVWRDIQTSVLRQGRQATLGEMTLEDFLSKAGVVPAESNSNMERSLVWPVQQGGFVGRPVPRPLGADSMPILDVMYRETAGLGMMPVTPGRKRTVVQVEEVVEKTVERKQKRMIKNRESAARSRARKQAYTNELENKILRLEEEIERLKKQKESEPVVHYVPQPEPKYQLRRTSSSPF